MPNATKVEPITITVQVAVSAVLIPEEKGGFSVCVPALPGCFSAADTVEEARREVVEAIEGWLECVHASSVAAAVRAMTEPLDSERVGSVKPVNGKRFCKALERLGWVFSHIKASHHVYKREGSPLTLAVPVHGNKDIPTGTQRGLMRQAGLTDADL